MNLFATSDCPIQSAIDLDLVRVNKMILECAQMLSSAVAIHMVGEVPNRANKGKYERLMTDLPELYKVSHANHPVSLWVRTNKANYLWTLDHMKSLGDVKVEATEKGHKSLELVDMLEQLVSEIPSGRLTDFANCAANKSLGLDFKHLPVHEAYKAYLKSRWLADKREPKWLGSKPVWC